MPAQTTYTDEPAVAIEGQLACRYIDAAIDTMFSGEASAEVPFGTAVMWGSATDGKVAKQPTSENAKIVGVVVHSHAHENGSFGTLGTTGVKPGGKLSVLRRGVIWVKCHTGCAPGDRLWVRGVSSGSGGERLGNCENADDSTDTVDCTGQGEWLTFAAAEGLAKLSVDFTNK